MLLAGVMVLVVCSQDQKKGAPPSPGAGWFYGVIECERHSSFHGMDDTSRAHTNCLFEKVMKYLLSIAGQISRRN